jgi:DNA (cytosine-5)-methyltransferase 1
MKYFSMFSGIGGFELGIGDKAKCIGYSEIDKYAIKVYKKHFGGHTNYGDATNINPTELPDFDLLVGGFPCQAFSVAGKRKGFDDTRGTLFFDIARILAEKKPKNLVLENVKGLLSHEQGRTFQTIIGVLSDLGYSVEWQVLNSKDFGVPQNRERVIIVGHLGSKCSRQVFPITGTDTKDTGQFVDLTIGNNSKLTKQSRTLQARYFKGYSKRPAETSGVIEQLNQPTHSNDRVYAESGISPTLNTMQGGNRQPFIAPVLTPNRIEKRQNGRRIKNDGEPSFTLTGQDIHGVQIDTRIRRLTPLECERLQGFPDNWTQYGIGDERISDTQRYKMCGNAVTTNVIQAVMEILL